MRILLVNQFFWPDTAATGQLLCDLADHLAERGASVTVICGSSGYGGADSREPPQARIVRLQNAAFSGKVGGRLGSYLSFLLGALWHGFRLEAPDVVVTLTTPPLLSLVGLALQRFRGARHLIWEMDIYPDVALDLGVLNSKSLAAGVFGWLADLPRRRAQQIIVLGECMRARLLAHGIAAEKITIAHNWADDPIRYEAPSQSRDSPWASFGPLSILYSGNLGLAHDAETIAQTILKLSDDTAVDFTFGGGGSRNAWLKQFCETNGVQNTHFLPYCERRALGARIAASHIGLVTQKQECVGSAVPSKVYGIMASGRPVLFIGPREATPALIVSRHHCGWQIDPGDVEGLVRLLLLLNRERDLVALAGARAYQAFRENYERSIGVARIAAVLGVEQPATEPEVVRAAAGA